MLQYLLVAVLPRFGARRGDYAEAKTCVWTIFNLFARVGRKLFDLHSPQSQPARRPQHTCTSDENDPSWKTGASGSSRPGRNGQGQNLMGEVRMGADRVRNEIGGVFSTVRGLFHALMDRFWYQTTVLLEASLFTKLAMLWLTSASSYFSETLFEYSFDYLMA